MPHGKAVWLELSEIERNELERLVRRHKTAQAVALRARIILLAADGLTNTAIAARLGVDLHRVGRWRQRFAGLRLDGLFDEPRPGAPRKIGDDEIAETIRRTLEARPERATHGVDRAATRVRPISPVSSSRSSQTVPSSRSLAYCGRTSPAKMATGSRWLAASPPESA